MVGFHRDTVVRPASVDGVRPRDVATGFQLGRWFGDIATLVDNAAVRLGVGQSDGLV